jgi:hypothetical protein
LLHRQFGGLGTFVNVTGGAAERVGNTHAQVARPPASIYYIRLGDTSPGIGSLPLVL